MAGTGQLMTKPDMTLDYETKMTYTVVVTVDDGSGESNATDSIAVTIQVKDLDEKPVLIVRRDPTFPAATAARSVAENTPAGGNIGAPVEASDDDALTYTLSGTDAGSFDIDAGTGQLRAKSALDYETKNTYTVTVTATDGEGATDEITVTINVTNEDELGMVSGDATVDYAENGTAAVATYTADGPASATWRLSGDDALDFTISNGGELTFAASPNHEAAADADTDNVYQVTVEADAGGEMGMVAVTVTVTNEDELGMVSGDATVDYAENGTAAVATYTADGPASATWRLSGDDALDFTISNGGELTFAASPNHEAAADADTDNVYQVTVEADAGGEMGMVAVTVTVTNEDELGMVSGDATVDYAENGTAAVATYTADGPASATWRLSGDDALDFTISNGGELTFAASPNHEAEADADTDNVYQVTVEADAGGEMGMVAVAVTVTNVDEDGTVTLSSTAPLVGAAITASVTDLDGGVTGETWVWASSDAMGGTYTDIAGATSDSYTPVAGDVGMYLQATASYTDAQGSDKSAAAVSANAVATNTSPMFDDGVDTEISVAENTAAGAIGNPFTATDADGDAPAYSLASGTDASFSIDAATGQLSTTAELDHETAMTYMVTVAVRDNEDDSGAADTAVDATHDVTVTVTNVDEDGTVTLSSGEPPSWDRAVGQADRPGWRDRWQRYLAVGQFQCQVNGDL